MTKLDPLTIKQAAAEAGLPYSTVYEAIARGTLKAIQPQQGRLHKISRVEFLIWLRTRRKRG
jgi:excisionase family DNA binding protein